MKPAQPHYNIAQRIEDRRTGDRVADIDAIAQALAEAERGGASNERERCSELLSVVVGVFKRTGIENDWTVLLDALSVAIRDERDADKTTVSAHDIRPFEGFNIGKTPLGFAARAYEAES